MFIFFHRPRSYHDEDEGPTTKAPRFKPKRTPVPHLAGEEIVTRSMVRRFFSPIDFFKLYFTVDLVTQLVKFTNDFAKLEGPKRPSVYENWVDLSVEEFYVFLGLLMYMAIVRVPSVDRYWNTKSLYHGLWARQFMTIKRFSQIMSFLKTSNPATEDNSDKLCKVKFLYQYIHRKCQKLYQPKRDVSIDERMVKNKGRYGFRQYIRDKPTKWGMKLWVLAEAATGYTYNFSVYLGRNTVNSAYGLSYDVVIGLIKSIENQGYSVFFDNF